LAGAFEKASLPEVGILGNDGKAMPGSILPDDGIASLAEADIANVNGVDW
jgi:hypothetical protein